MVKWIALGSAGIVLAFFGIWGMGFAFAWWSAPWTGALEERQQVNRGAFRIQEYERFYELRDRYCASGYKIEQYEQSDLARKDTVIAGTTATLYDAALEYNSNSEQERTSAKWKDSGLPDRLNPSTFDPSVCL